MPDHGYYQKPSIRDDTVVFVSEDDLWSVPADGGLARRLTANPGRANDPSHSPDGAWLAFTGRDEGGDEVYLMPAEGGPARRLTYLGARTRVVGWEPGGEAIVFASDYREPFPGNTRLYRLAPDERPAAPEDLGVGHGVSIAFGPNAARALARNAVELAHWKRYRGGTTGELWVDAGDGAWRRLPSLGGNVAQPLWLGERLYFVSDHEGTGNLYSCLGDGEDLRRHTDHQDYYVRQPSGDGKRIVYQSGADLWLFDPAEGEARPIRIGYASPRAERQRRFVPAPEHLEQVAIDTKGRRLALTTRGQAFTLPATEGPAQRRGANGYGRRRLPTFLFDGRLAVISDTGGEERLELYPAADRSEPERVYPELDLGHPLRLVASPTAAALVVLDQEQRLHLVDLDAGTSVVLDRSRHGPVQGAAFSPDGAHVAYGLPTRRATVTVRLVELATRDAFDATAPLLVDAEPAFDPSGRYLYFIGSRTLDPVYDSVTFDLAFPRSQQPFLVTLRQDVPNPIVPGADPAAHHAAQAEDATRRGVTEPTDTTARDAAGSTDAAERDGAEADDGPGREIKKAEALNAAPEPPRVEPVRIDRDGITDRVIALPVPLGSIGRVRGTSKRVLYATFPVEGALNHPVFDTGTPAAKGTLQAFDLATRSSEVVMEGISDFELSADGETLLVRVGNRLRVFPSSGKAPGDDATGVRSGWVDLGRLRVSVDPPAEWEQIFQETWRLQRDLFWTEDMSGIDWRAVYQRYHPLLQRVGTRNELNDLLWEVQGELGTSHAYVFGGELRPEPTYPQGKLGASLHHDPDGEGYRITDLIRGDPWDESSASPLARAGVLARPGDRLLRVDGQPLSAEQTPDQLLVNRAGTEVRLTLARDGSERDVVVKTLTSEAAGRYRDWVNANRARVHQASDGALGYLHVPDMMPRGFSEFHRGWLLEQERDGLVVDVRYNGGGHVSSLLLEKLARRRVAYTVGRFRDPVPFPEGAMAGPLIALANEHAGSDGDIFSHLFKLLELGPLIGTRTWGGVVGIDVGETFVDGGFSTQPAVAFWFQDVGWQVENYGTDPTIEVVITPQEDADGRDPQLERAIEEGLARLRRAPLPPVPDLGSRPDNRPAKLPTAARTTRRG